MTQKSCRPERQGRQSSWLQGRLTITMASEDFQKLQENPQANGMQLFFAGKLKVSGNQMLAMKLQKLFSFQ